MSKEQNSQLGTDARRLDGRFQSFQDQLSEVVKTLTLKVERLNQKMAQNDVRVDGIAQELRAKYASISGRITEKNLAETEIQSLFERHNQVIRNFEVRLTQMQRLIESQQMQLMNAHAALEESRREMARLKRV